MSVARFTETKLRITRSQHLRKSLALSNTESKKFFMVFRDFCETVYHNIPKTLQL